MQSSCESRNPQLDSWSSTKVLRKTTEDRGMHKDMVPEKIDRVRANTCDKINQRIDRQTERNIAAFVCSGEEEISERLNELADEWDMERVLQLHATVISAGGCILSMLKGKGYLAIPLTVSAFLMNHAVRGWCPPLPLFRRLGVRTRSEIDAEIFALKAIRGDFDDVQRIVEPMDRTAAAIDAVSEFANDDSETHSEEAEKHEERQDAA